MTDILWPSELIYRFTTGSTSEPGGVLYGYVDPGPMRVASSDRANTPSEQDQAVYRELAARYQEELERRNREEAFNPDFNRSVRDGRSVLAPDVLRQRELEQELREAQYREQIAQLKKLLAEYGKAKAEPVEEEEGKPLRRVLDLRRPKCEG